MKYKCLKCKKLKPKVALLFEDWTERYCVKCFYGSLKDSDSIAKESFEVAKPIGIWNPKERKEFDVILLLNR